MLTPRQRRILIHMCYDDDSAPPVYGPPLTSATADRLTLTSADGTRLAAFHTVPERPAGPGVVILPDVRGLHGFYKDLAVRLAEQGHEAIAFDYYGRTTAIEDERGADFPIMEHVAKLTRDGIQADLLAAKERLGAEQAVALGFCMGGRNAFFAAEPRLGFRGVIGFYGAPGIAGPYGPGPTQHAKELACPILGLFGGADAGIPLSAVAEFDDALNEAGVDHELIVYPGAPHSFFDARQDEHAQAAADAWQRVLAFLRS